MTIFFIILTILLVFTLNAVLLAIFAILDNDVAINQYSFNLSIIPGINIFYFLLNLYLCIKCCKIKFQTTESFKNLIKNYIQNVINYQYEKRRNQS